MKIKKKIFLDVNGEVYFFEKSDYFFIFLFIYLFIFFFWGGGGGSCQVRLGGGG